MTTQCVEAASSVMYALSSVGIALSKYKVATGWVVPFDVGG